MLNNYNRKNNDEDSGSDMLVILDETWYVKCSGGTTYVNCDTLSFNDLSYI